MTGTIDQKIRLLAEDYNNDDGLGSWINRPKTWQ